MISKTARANLALSLAAVFWGVTFIFQREAMAHLTPLAYGGIRFTVGALALLPFALPRALKLAGSADDAAKMLRGWLCGGLISGGFIFAGASFQQYGLLWTTAGKAGFITSLYVVLAPLILRLAGQKISPGEAAGIALAVGGLYLLSFTGGFSPAPGDGLVLIGAFIWAGHILALSWLSPRMDSLVLGAGQALVCGLMGLAAAAAMDQWPSRAALAAAWFDILWGGLFSVTLGFTCQVIGQKDAKPVPAAIIMQMEAVVAAVAGWLFLNEVMTPRMLTGAVVMLAGMMISQLWPIMTRNSRDWKAPPA
ncbi:MAG: DMT family transporter [Candidatus Adiutrix sp.]|jgi:drug/metabolite transporter (DMT)-like permease|nr:DMT family transporter [Candidatus Adiutrix sp.]